MSEETKQKISAAYQNRSSEAEAERRQKSSSAVKQGIPYEE